MVHPPSTHGGSSPPQPPSNAAAHQYIQQYLSSVLSQRGPSSLPYSEDSKWLIRQHLVTLTESYPSLQPKTAAYTHNDGCTATLLQADGTVPVPFHGITYNIPVVIWLTEPYPRHPPLVYVNPTPDMIIKRHHPFVNPSSGAVSIPYLSPSNWIYPSSNLLDLARHLTHYFARDPPLYSQRPSPNPSPNPNSSPNFPPSGSVSVRPAIPPRSYPQSPYGSSNGRIVTEDPAEVFKRNAINKLVESLHGDIGAVRKAREAEMEGVFSAQAVLRQREEQLAKGLRELEGENEALERQLQMVLTNADVLERWLRENEGKVANTRSVEVVDEAFEPCDALSKQMLECSASDLGIEDVIYALDKAVQQGSIPVVQYLRNVRSLSREQFFHRATNSKVRAAQMQAQVSSMAARVPPQAV